MEFGVIDFLTLIGALGFFIYGMKVMSDGIQKVAGSKMRSILSKMTSTRFLGITTGFILTALLQSSSATTVMIVSFVNAGLLTLIESIGVIMGANIGTTGTIWLAGIMVSDGMPVGTTKHIALVHTGVNALMAVTLLPFVHPIARFISKF